MSGETQPVAWQHSDHAGILVSGARWLGAYHLKCTSPLPAWPPAKGRHAVAAKSVVAWIEPTILAKPI